MSAAAGDSRIGRRGRTPQDELSVAGTLTKRCHVKWGWTTATRLSQVPYSPLSVHPHLISKKIQSCEKFSLRMAPLPKLPS